MCPFRNGYRKVADSVKVIFAEDEGMKKFFKQMEEEESRRDQASAGSDDLTRWQEAVTPKLQKLFKALGATKGLCCR